MRNRSHWSCIKMKIAAILLKLVTARRTPVALVIMMLSSVKLVCAGVNTSESYANKVLSCVCVRMMRTRRGYATACVLEFYICECGGFFELFGGCLTIITIYLYTRRRRIDDASPTDFLARFFHVFF